jgi:hypothetical protein
LNVAYFTKQSKSRSNGRKNIKKDIALKRIMAKLKVVVTRMAIDNYNNHATLPQSNSCFDSILIFRAHLESAS